MATQRHGIRGVAVSALIGVAIVVALVAAALAAGVVELPGRAQTGAQSEQTSAQVGQTHEVVDSLGRTVSVSNNPQRIACFDAFSGNVCVLAGAGNRLVGVPGGVISNVLLNELSPGLSDVAKLSGNSVNEEELLSSGVDVAFVRADMASQEGQVAKFSRYNIPYIVVDYSTVEGQIEAIRLVGEVCGGESAERAESIASYYEDTVALVSDRLSDVAPADYKKVYHSVNDVLLTDGANSLGADWISRCGAVDVSAGEEGAGTLGDYSATLEQVYAWNPDVIVCSTADARRAIEADAKWAGLSAVANDQVKNLPVSTSRWGQRGDPETFLGMLWLASELYPERFADIDVKDEVVSYYRDVIGLDIDDETWDAIVSGEGLRTQGKGAQGEK